MMEKRNPTRWDLDKVSPNHPIILKRTFNHMAVCNSKVLEISHITEDTPSSDGGYIEREKDTEKLTGLVQEKAQGMIDVSKYDVKDIIKGMKLAKTVAKWGINLY